MNDRKLHIGGDHSVKELQEEFSRIYPFLKIEFYDKTHGYRRLAVTTPLFPGRLRNGNGSGLPDARIELSDQMTVRELEKKLFDQFGLSAQVYRKSGNLWMETTMTDHWTLKDQNDHGREISSPNTRDGLGTGWVGL